MRGMLHRRRSAINATSGEGSIRERARAQGRTSVRLGAPLSVGYALAWYHRDAQPAVHWLEAACLAACDELLAGEAAEGEIHQHGWWQTDQRPDQLRDARTQGLSLAAHDEGSQVLSIRREGEGAGEGAGEGEGEG
jgi:hypothetical protein